MITKEDTQEIFPKKQKQKNNSELKRMDGPGGGLRFPLMYLLKFAPQYFYVRRNEGSYPSLVSTKEFRTGHEAWVPKDVK